MEMAPTMDSRTTKRTDHGRRQIVSGFMLAFLCLFLVRYKLWVLVCFCGLLFFVELSMNGRVDDELKHEEPWMFYIVR